MDSLKLTIKAPYLRRILLVLFLCVYLASGIYTELRLVATKPPPNGLFSDFGVYENALKEVLARQDPYAIRLIGAGYLYPPPALLIVELFSRVTPFRLRVILFSAINTVFIALMIYGLARHYGNLHNKVWYWYVICLGFAPFLELIYVGQINVITLWGLFMLIFWEDTSPILSGVGLGIAIMTKVTPVLFFGYLVVNKKWKVLVSTLAVMVVFIGLSIWRYGFLPFVEYPNLFLWLLNQFPLGINSQSLVAKLASESAALIQIIKTGFPQYLMALLFPVLTFFTNHYDFVQKALSVYTILTIAFSGLFTFYGKQPREPLFIVTALGMMLSPNVLWYHHYVFFLLPLLIWMGWQRLDWRVVVWCLGGLLIIQIDRWLLTNGFLIHIFGQLSLLSILLWQARRFFARRKVERVDVDARV